MQSPSINSGQALRNKTLNEGLNRKRTTSNYQYFGKE